MYFFERIQDPRVSQKSPVVPPKRQLPPPPCFYQGNESIKIKHITHSVELYILWNKPHILSTYACLFPPFFTDTGSRTVFLGSLSVELYILWNKPHILSKNYIWENVRVFWYNVGLVWKNVGLFWENVGLFWENVGLFWENVKFYILWNKPHILSTYACLVHYGVATISRLLKITDLFCKRAL